MIGIGFDVGTELLEPASIAVQAKDIIKISAIFTNRVEQMLPQKGVLTSNKEAGIRNYGRMLETHAGTIQNMKKRRKVSSNSHKMVLKKIII